MPQPIDNWIVLIPGYLQTLGAHHQGVPALWHELWDKFKDRGVCVIQHPWNTDWGDVAETIFRSGMNGQPPRIMLVAYSWGVGYGACNLLRELRYRDLRVEAAVFSDGVYHLGGALAHRCGVAQVSAYLTRPWGRPAVAIPDNIVEPHWFVQDRSNFQLRDRMTWLRGHELVWESSGDRLPNGRTVVGTVHRFMDEYPRFKEVVIDVADRMFGALA